MSRLNSALILRAVKGTGPDGRVTETRRARCSQIKGSYASEAFGTRRSPPKAAEGSSRINLSGMRKVIAERLVASKGPVPHFYLNIDIDAGPLMAARAELKSAGEDTDTSKITVNDFVLESVGHGRGQSSQGERFIR